MSEEDKALLRENNALLKDIHSMMTKMMNPEHQSNELMKAMMVNILANMLVKK
jgi:hypothetical protein